MLILQVYTKKKNSIRVNEPVKSEIDNLDAFERDLIKLFLNSKLYL